MACIYIYGEEEARKKASSEFINEKAKSIDDFRKLGVEKSDSLYELKSKVFDKISGQLQRFLDYSEDTASKIEKIRKNETKISNSRNEENRVTTLSKKIIKNNQIEYTESEDDGSKFLDNASSSLGTAFHEILRDENKQEENIQAFLNKCQLRRKDFDELPQEIKNNLQDNNLVKFLQNYSYQTIQNGINLVINSIKNSKEIQGLKLEHELLISDNNKQGISGQIDMFGYDKNGNLRIFDFKTSSNPNVSNYTKLYRYVQLEMYKRLLLQNGIQANNIELLNILINFNPDGTIEFGGFAKSDEVFKTIREQARINQKIEKDIPIRLNPITTVDEQNKINEANNVTENLFSSKRLNRQKKINFEEYIKNLFDKEQSYTTADKKHIRFKGTEDNLKIIDVNTEEVPKVYEGIKTLQEFINQEFESRQNHESEVLSLYIQALRSKRKDKIRSLIKSSNNTEQQSERLLRNIGKYINDNWDYLKTPLETFGIITMVNKSNPDNTYLEFIQLTNDIGIEENLNSPIKLINGELLLDDLIPQSRQKKYLGYEKLPAATIGNVRLLQSLIRIGKFQEIFKGNPKIGNIIVLSTIDGSSTYTLDFNPLLTTLKILQSESNDKDSNFENKDLFKSIYSDLSNIQIADFRERTSLQIIDAVKQLNEDEQLNLKIPDNFSQPSKDAKLKALEKLELDLEHHLRSNNEWVSIEQRKQSGYQPSEGMQLYMTVGVLINNIKNMPTTNSMTVSQKAFTFYDSLYAAAQLLIDGRMRQYTPDGMLITGLAQGLNTSSSYTSPDENAHRINLAIDTYMAVLRQQFLSEVKEINDSTIKFLEWVAQSRALGKLQDYTLGYHTDAYMQLMKRTDDGKLDSSFQFINPYQKNNLVTEQLDFLETILWHINRFRIPLKDEIKKLSLQELKNSEHYNTYRNLVNSDTKWLNIPIKAGSTIRLFIQGAKEVLVGDETETRKEKLTQWAERMWDRIKECYDPKYLTKSQTDRKKRAERLLEPFNYYDEGSSRTERLQKQRPSQFELNLNYLCVDYVFCSIKEKIEKDLLRTVDRQISGLLLYEMTTGQNVSNQINTIIDRVKVSIYNENLIDENYKDLATLIGIGKKLGSYTKIALRPMLYAKELLAGRIRNLSALCADFIYNGEKITFNHMMDAAAVVFGEGLFFEKIAKMSGSMHAGEFALVDWINNTYAITDRDMNIYSERLSADRYGIGNQGTRTLYNNTVRPDWFNRMIIFIAKMKADGCFDAHKIVDGEIIYNMKDDSRFDEYYKHKNNSSYTSENFRKQKALYEAMMNDFIESGFINTKTGEKLKMGDDLPMAYTPKERNSIKEQIGSLYGYYDHEEKPLFQSDTWYNMFMQFTTYIPGELKRWFNTGKNSSIGSYVQLKDEQGNLLYVYQDPETLLDKITTESEIDGVKLQPYTKWEGHQVEGLMISLLKTCHDLCTLQVKDKLNDPLHAEQYKQQYKNSMLALFQLLFMGLIGYFILMLMTGGTGKKNEMSQQTAIMYDLVTKAANDISFYNAVVQPALNINFAGESYFADIVGDTFKAFSHEDYGTLNALYDNLSLIKDTHFMDNKEQ